MKYCCVPLCNSSWKDAEKISFHEFPSDEARRKSWILAIARLDLNTGKIWQPSDCSKVCEKHFTKEDYSISTKRQILLRHVVPSVFPNYPSYLIKRSIPEKNIEIKTKISTPLLEKNTSNSIASSNHSLTLGVFQKQSISQSQTSAEDANLFLKNISTPEKNASSSNISLSLDVSAEQSPSQTQSSSVANNNLVHHSIINPGKTVSKKLYMKIRSLKRQNNSLRHKLKKLRKHLADIKKSKKEKLSAEEKKFRGILQDSKDKNELAAMIVKQVKKYGKKRANYTKAVPLATIHLKCQKTS